MNELFASKLTFIEIFRGRVDEILRLHILVRLLNCAAKSLKQSLHRILGGVVFAIDDSLEH